ncbi:MAG: glycine cleavage system protein R [Acidimicrobiales bacterium]
MATLVLTIIGDDRSGLVDALSGVVVDNGGNWHKSHLAELAGKFAGIVLVTVPDTKADQLIAALAPLETNGLLDVSVEVAAVVAATPSSAGPQAGSRYHLELVGQDRPGIVHEISEALAGRRVNITELNTATSSAPMAGGTLFTAVATLQVPGDAPIDELRHDLEAIADELMVDLDLDLESDTDS